MRILVIGGTLFIGRAIVERLVAGGHEVTVLHRRDRHSLGPHVANVKADRSDLSALARILADGRYDVVVDTVYDWENGTPAAQVEAAARACGSQLQR
jgi:nucleoside-diphosphate-sugar epimerase